MSFKTALASCWDICKRNCINMGKSNGKDPRGFPGFSLELYETYYVSSEDNLVYPYDKKPLRSSRPFLFSDSSVSERGITEFDDKLVSSFLGWIFTLLEMLVWAALAVGATVASVLALVLLTVTILSAPFFLRFNRDGVFAYKYSEFLKITWASLGIFVTFTFLAFFKVPFHLIKAIVRIPAGVVVAVQEVVSPSRVTMSHMVNSDAPYFQIPSLRRGDDNFNSIHSFIDSRTPVFERQRTTYSDFESDNDEDSFEDNEPYSPENSSVESIRSYEDTLNSIGQALPGEIDRVSGRLLAENPHMNPEILRFLAMGQVIGRFHMEATRMETPNNSSSNDLDDAINVSFNESSRWSSAPIKARETKVNWGEEQLEKLEVMARPSRYTCVISLALMNPPFLVIDGNMYDESSIETHFSNNGRKSPLTNEIMPQTRLKGIELQNVKNEMVCFVVALRANYHLDKIRGQEGKDSGVNKVLAIAAEIEKNGTSLHEQINKHVKERHKKNLTQLANEIINNQSLVISTAVIVKAWGNIKTLVGASEDSSSFLNKSPTNALAHFFSLTKKMDASFDNLIINVLREAILEEQGASKAYVNTWNSPTLAKDNEVNELSSMLNLYLPSEPPKNLIGLAIKIFHDTSISDRVLQYTLLLINNPTNTVSFDQFKPKKTARTNTINELLGAFYKPENALLKPVFLMTIKETILQEASTLQPSSKLSNGFDPLWQQENKNHPVVKQPTPINSSQPSSPLFSLTTSS